MSSKPPISFAKKSALMDSDEILESIYEDPDAVMGAVADGGQSQSQKEFKVKPVPRPRTKSQMIHHLHDNNTADSLNKTPSTTNAAISRSMRQSVDFKTLIPAHPPPRPPKNVYVNSAASVRGNSEYSRTIPEATPRHWDPSLEKKPPPPLPLRPDPPPPSPLYYADRSPSAWSLRSESGTETARQSRPSSVSSMSQRPVSPVLSEDMLSSYSTYQSQTRPSPPSFRPPPPPSELNSYRVREFPTYIVPIEPEMMPDPDVNSLYQLSVDDITRLLTWLKRVSSEPDATAPSLYGLNMEEEIISLNKKAMNVRIARRLYNLLMIKRRESLQNRIIEFQSICDKLEKVKEKNKKMGIAGGTTGAVGGVAAVVGIALAPMTMGASLIATAVGAGMVASAGGIGAHAAKNNKKTVNRMTVEKMVNDYESDVTDIDLCLQFILSVMNELRRHNIVRLQSAGAHPDALRMADLSQVVFRNMNNNRWMSSACSGGVTSGSLLKAFQAEIDVHFTEKNNQKLKKANKGKFAGRVSSLAKALKEELDYLIQMWEMMC